jgi:hypothetical protein
MPPRMPRPLAVVLLSALVSGAGAQINSVAFAEHGRAFLKDLGEPEPPDLPTLLERHYTSILLADFDLRVPRRMFENGDEVARVATIANALLALQDQLVDWTTDPGAQKAVHAELAALRKYVGSWRGKPIASEAPAVPPRVQPCVLVIAPERRSFVGLVGWLGLWKQVYQDYWWFDATAQFSDLRLQDEGHVQIVALEYAAPDQKGDVTLGYDMNTREKTGMLQHVLQRAAVSWCWRWLGNGADTTFVLGFATDLVVDVLGQNNARSGGSGKSHSTEGQGGFIPGAPSAGGGMPVQNADSNWRDSLGQDWFARALRQAQKAGEHEAADKDRLGHFLLHDQKGARKHLVSAPFLGEAAFVREAVPDPFLDDYLEFHRSYRAAFVHWLQTHGGKTKPASAEQFRTLLRRIMEQKEGATFDALCQEIYGLPLSAKAADTSTLERRFLAWIAESSR